MFGPQERFLNLSLLILRFGLGFVFLYAGSFKVANPTVAGMFHMSSGLFTMIGVLEMLSGIGVLFGFLTRPSAIYQTVILLGAIFVVGGGSLTNSFVPLDVGLLMMPLVLLLCGAGRYSVDARLADRNH
ncbi:MAG TPA: DoxX family protein [Candidatus Acidoferrum sp.]|nr:DoxX family protein [Candidatus Acidoferrum sp.]